MHARTEATYTLGKRFKRLKFIAGIDGKLRHGAAVLSVTVDDKQAIKPMSMQRDAEPRAVSIDLQGIETLTITVDFADGTYGSGGRVNLCDAWLIE
jgi:hypothetical protein